MNYSQKRRLVRLSIVLALAAIVLCGLSMVQAQATNTPPDWNADDNCSALDSGKIDTTGDPATMEVTAPEGYLIDFYCVKAGQVKNGGGSVFVDVVPPAETVIIDHPGKDSVSNYSYHLIIKPPVVEETTTTTEGTTTTSEATTTTTAPSSTTTTEETSTTTTIGVTTTAQVTTVPSSPTTTATIVAPPTPEELPFTGVKDWLLPLGILLLATGGLVVRKASA
jgi:hypothetical protein